MTLIIDAIYEDGMLRPLDPLPLQVNQKVRISLEILEPREWPEDVAELYRESAEEDREIVRRFGSEMGKTWPKE